jgi:Tol biopolymer transport system component
MDEPSPGSPPPQPPEDRLDSWKEIAAYLKRDVSTVQRWEKREGMPVHRHLHDKLGSVYALRSDLDAWSHSRSLPLARDEVDGEPPVDSLGSQADDQPTAVREPILEDANGVRRRGFVWPMIAAGAVLSAGMTVWFLERADYFWQSPIANAQFEQVTNFEGTEQAAAISRDGKFVAFLSDRDGRMDAWVTQVGTGQFYNLTKGSLPELVNPSVRTTSFSPDGALVFLWVRKPDGSKAGDIGIWAVPTLGGPPRPYLEGVAELDWSNDGSRLVYHTPGPGDPTFVKDPNQSPAGREIFAAPPGLHAHFPLWSHDQAFIYFVQGSVPDAMDVWRIRPTGGAAERITFHNSRVSYPTLLTQRTLLYLASDADGSGPWLYSLDVERRIPHRISSGVDRYASLAASADGRRLVATLANPKATLWRLPISDKPVEASAASRITLTTGSGFSPRLGPDYLLYVSSKGASDGIWKLVEGTATELWTAPGARIIGGPAIAADARRIAFSIEQRGRTRLYMMNADGTNARVVTESLELRGAPAWAPDGQSITLAANDAGVPRLFRVSLDGRPPVPLVSDYSIDPAWAPDGHFLVYSGPDIGTTFPVKAVTADGRPFPLPNLTLTRGARRLCFLPGRRALVILRGEIEHKNLWLIDLETGTERQLTNFGRDFVVRDFDVSPDGREIVLDRVQENLDIVLLDLPASN